jgi:hypothetical protein
MNKCYLQRWEESERGWGVRPDGCSMHLTEFDHDLYVRSIYKERADEVPDEYERVCGRIVEAFVSDDIFEKVKERKNIRVWETQLNNMISIEDIIIK